ncbi:MAG: InlB B-repeat-containing protein, partial [Coriobacteriales bacterium]|nr:InlB B-repeat-containing protein [Coriobacteriales bacterium]
MSLVLTIGLVLGSLLYSINVFASGTTVEISNSMSAAEVETLVQEVLDGSVADETIEVLGSKTDEVALITLTIPAGTTLLWKAETEGLTFNTLGEGSFVYSPATNNDASGTLPADEDVVEAAEDIPASVPDAGDQPESGTTAVQENPALSASGLAVLELKAVRLAGTGTSFDTFSEAIAAATAAGLSTYTIEVGGDVAGSGTVTITANVTIIGVDGPHTITPGLIFKVDNGGSLTLGNGSTGSLLTFKSAYVQVLNGSVTTYDGVNVDSTGFSYYGTLRLEGPNAMGAIHGGTFTGITALDLSRGAYISEISGGSFYGVQDAVHVSDAGTRVELISGGSFYQTTPNQSLHGHAFFLQNNAVIGNISGGHFEAVDNCAMVVIRGAWIEQISGGVFKANRVGTYDADDRNSVVWIEGDPSCPSVTGVGSISGGSFSGGFFGVLVINLDPSEPYAQIDSISGGTLLGIIGLQNDVNGRIGEISGGTIKSIDDSYAVFNVGTIDKISGSVEISGLISVVNYQGSRINEISGGTFTGGAHYGFYNSGIIEKISGGTFSGWGAMYNTSAGHLNVITGGAFWGKTGSAIYLSYPLQLEPGLAADIGFGRYQAANGKIFNDESLVKYPDPKYYMSDTNDTLSVPGVNDTGFRYLRQADYQVTVNKSYAANSGAGSYVAGQTVTIDAGNREGYAFIGWTLNSGKVVLDNDKASSTTFTMPAEAVTVTANWKLAEYQVTVVDSYATKTGAGSYYSDDPVAIDAGSREGYVFAGWLTSDGAAFANAQSVATSFVMPYHNVTVTATWRAIDYKVTVVGSYATESGEGTYHLGDQVTIDVGSRRGYAFAGWQVDLGAVTLADPSLSATGFEMPAADVTVTATWQPINYKVTVVDSYADPS